MKQSTYHLLAPKVATRLSQFSLNQVEAIVHQSCPRHSSTLQKLNMGLVCGLRFDSLRGFAPLTLFEYQADSAVGVFRLLSAFLYLQHMAPPLWVPAYKHHASSTYQPIKQTIVTSDKATTPSTLFTSALFLPCRRGSIPSVFE